MQNHLEISSKTQFWNLCFLCNTFFSKNHSFWPPYNGYYNVFWWKNNFLQISGRNTLENADKITSKTKFSTPIVQFSSPLHPASSYSLKYNVGTKSQKKMTTYFLLTDCYLRQGAGGMKIARLGSRTLFLRWFSWRSQAYLEQIPGMYNSVISVWSATSLTLYS